MGETERIIRLHQDLGIPDDYQLRTTFSKQSTPPDLVSIGPDMFGREQKLRAPAAKAWISMHLAAKETGIDIQIVSAYRSVEYQVELIRRKLAGGETLNKILKTLAAPGYSEHQGGCAVDIGGNESEPVTEAFDQTKAYLWLQDNASTFNFFMSYPRDNSHGMVYEPWHWCFAAEDGLIV